MILLGAFLDFSKFLKLYAWGCPASWSLSSQLTPLLLYIHTAKIIGVNFAKGVEYRENIIKIIYKG